jgi:hypothetical protein
MGARLHSSFAENSLRVPTHRSAEPGSPAVRVDFDDRAELLAAAPDIYYVTGHYLGYSAALARLSRVTPDVLRDVLGMAHNFVKAHKERRSSPKGSEPSPKTGEIGAAMRTTKHGGLLGVVTS